MQRICKNCYAFFEDGTELEPKSNNTAYCSNRCEKEFKRRFPEINKKEVNKK